MTDKAYESPFLFPTFPTRARNDKSFEYITIHGTLLLIRT